LEKKRPPFSAASSSQINFRFDQSGFPFVGSADFMGGGDDAVGGAKIGGDDTVGVEDG
jgi:hypothetical protein